MKSQCNEWPSNNDDPASLRLLVNRAGNPTIHQSQWSMDKDSAGKWHQLWSPSGFSCGRTSNYYLFFILYFAIIVISACILRANAIAENGAPVEPLLARWIPVSKHNIHTVIKALVIFQWCQSQIIFYEFTFKLKININKNLPVYFTV